MFRRIRLALGKLIVAVVTWGSAGPCLAGVVFTLGNNPQPGEENVLLNKGTTGSAVFGTTNQSGTTVEFDSATQTLFEPANGQARIEATSGGTQVALSDVSSIDIPNGSYTDLIFNPHIGGTIGTSGGTATVTVSSVDQFGVPEPASTFTYTLGNGENFLTVTTTGGERITNTAISYPTGFTDLRQVRISGAAVVPEPASLTLLGVGAVGLLGYGWRKRRPTPA